MPKFLQNLLLVFLLLILSFGMALAQEEETAAEDGEAITASTTMTSSLIISLAEDNPLSGTLYNAGDKAKPFLSFVLRASSTEDIHIERLSFMITNSLSSSFFNPAVIGDNIENIIAIDKDNNSELEWKKLINVSSGKTGFTVSDLTIPQGKNKQFFIYADIAAEIEYEVAGKIDLIDPGRVKARGVETDSVIEVFGEANGNFLNLGPAMPKPDLVVTSIRINQDLVQNNLVVEEKSYITIIYQNIGTGPVSEGFIKQMDFGQGEGVFEFMNDGEPLLSDSLFALNPGHLSPAEEYTEIYGGVFKRTGPLTLKVVLDPENEIDEINDRNNEFKQEVLIDTELNYPDFIVYDIVVTPGSPVAGENVTIDVVYKNIGSDFGRDKNDFLTKAYFGYIEGWFIFDAFSPMITSRTIPTEENLLHYGETYTETYCGYFRRAKEMTLEAAIDPTNRVMELNEDNNRMEKIIIVREKSIGGLAAKLKGKIVLKVETNGEAYYINPWDESVHYLGRPADAFRVMREQGVGITNLNLARIPIGAANLSGTDTDEDGLPDNFEDTIGTDKNKADTDEDGLSDAEELDRGF